MARFTFRAKNFRSLRDCEVTLGPFTSLVGSNGSGKSNLLRALETLSRVVDPGQGAILEEWLRECGGAEQICTDGKPSPVELGLEVALSGRAYEYGVAFEIDEHGHNFHIVREHLIVDGTERARVGVDASYASHVVTAPEGRELRKEHRSKRSALGEFHPRPPDIGAFLDFVTGWRFYDFQPAMLGAPAAARRQERLDPLGAELASYVHTLATEEPELLEQVRARMQEAVPGIKALAAPYSKAKSGHVELRLRMDSSRASLRWDSLAGGHKKALAVVAALMERPAPTLLALEEPDAGLHPSLLQWLVEFLRGVSNERVVLTTTHHPWFVDQLRLDEIRVLDAPDGATRIQAPSAEGEARRRIEAALGTAAMTGSLIGATR